jgi:hypothetical protein
MNDELLQVLLGQELTYICVSKVKTVGGSLGIRFDSGVRVFLEDSETSEVGVKASLKRFEHKPRVFALFLNFQKPFQFFRGNLKGVH